MKAIRILILDDSVVFRSQIRAALEGIQDIEVVATVASGRIALKKLQEGPVDLVISDLEMPEMTGIEFLQELKKLSLSPKVIVFSSFSTHGAEITMEALRLGASDFVPKPNGENLGNSYHYPGDNVSNEPKDKIRALLLDKIFGLFNVTPGTSAGVKLNQVPVSVVPKSIEESWDTFSPKVIVIGSSTGGPNALEAIFSKIKAPFSCPILITQHMPPLFTAILAKRLESVSQIPSAEAQHNEPLQSNRIYVAPGDYHMRLTHAQSGIQITLDKNAHEHSVRPAVNPLFVSAAKIFGRACLGIVLTGMGEDGKIGAQEIKKMGGKVMIQNKESCVVFGMPGAVFLAGAYDKVGDPQTISETLINLVALKKRM
ncbi:MAG: chemotaxis-specific protein-glutamate methyltransferase CheB [Bdellovibrionia bacterium]